MKNNITYLANISPDVDVLNDLMAKVWSEHTWTDYNRVLAKSFCHITAYSGNELIGFINVAWDGNKHAFILDTSVCPDHQNNGVGKALVFKAIECCKNTSIEWIHVDYEERYEYFYHECGFTQKTAAALLNLR